jgi:uncharacterized membrane protein YphA (DoxX/SURF4 family)
MPSRLDRRSVAVNDGPGRSAAPGRWQSRASMAAAVALGALFVVSGGWKMLDLQATAERMVQTLVPVRLSAPVAFATAVTEVTAGLLLLVGRYRRWGAWAAGLMLVAFMLYIGILYDRLLGEDCNCFPWIRRVVGPAFFVGNTAMLALAVAAGRWARTPRGWRGAVGILGATALLGAGAYAGTWVLRSGAEAPASVLADGQPFGLRDGRVLLYFVDPECSHCYVVGRQMSGRDWGATRILVVPVREPQFAVVFLEETGLRAAISRDVSVLRGAFPFTEAPYAVALDRGRAVARFHSGQMADGSWYGALERLGHLH